MKQRQGLFGTMAAAGLVLGILGVQLVPTEPKAPEEPAWRQFGTVATAQPDRTYSYVDYLPDFGRMPLHLANWSASLPELPELPPLPIPEPEPPAEWAAAEDYDTLPLDPPPVIPVLARSSPHEVLVLTTPQEEERPIGPQPVDLAPLLDAIEEEAYGG